MKFAGLNLLVCCLALILGGCNGTQKPNPPEPDNGGDTEVGNGSDHGQDEPKVRPEEFVPKPETVADSGEKEFVKAFWYAVIGKDGKALRAALAPWLANEAKRQYGSFDAYVEASNKALDPLAAKLEEPTFGEPHHFEGDAGNFISLEANGRKLIFYLIKSDGEWKIDNCLTQGTLDIPDSAPALGVATLVPGVAFLVYYHGALMGQHPTQERLRRTIENQVSPNQNQPFTDPLSSAAPSMRSRLAYLRSSCSARFITTLKNDPTANGSIAQFLMEGQKIMEQRFRDPLFPDDLPYKAHIDVDFHAIDKTQRTNSLRLFCIREHGTYRLDQQTSRSD